MLGPPLVTGQLAGERLSRPLALGVLSCDGLSSAAYGTEPGRLIRLRGKVGIGADGRPTMTNPAYELLP